MDHDIITATIGEFCRLSGLGRSKVYELISAGDLNSVVIGGRRLIVLDSWRRLVNSAQRDQAPRQATSLPPVEIAAGRRRRSRPAEAAPPAAR